MTSTGSALDMLVIKMADVVYPPALLHFRRWLDEGHFDLQVTAACALDSALGQGKEKKPFDIVGKIGGPQRLLREAMDALRVAWDAAPVSPELDVCINAERAFNREVKDVPPREPTLSPEHAQQRLKSHRKAAALLKRLPPLLAHRVDHALAGRLLPLWSAAFPDDDSLARVHAVVGKHLNGEIKSSVVYAQRPIVGEAVTKAGKAAAYSQRHRRWRNLKAAAAYSVGQCFHYLIDTSSSARGVGSGFGYNAIVLAGLGGKACLVEVARYLDDAVAATAEVDVFLALLNGRIDPAVRDDEDAIPWLVRNADFPSSSTTLLVPSMTLSPARVANCTWKSGQVHRAAWDGNTSRIDPDKRGGVYNPFDFLKAEKFHNAESFALTVFEIYKDLHELQKAVGS